LGLITQDEINATLAKLAARRLTNWRGLEIGEIRPVFELKVRWG